MQIFSPFGKSAAPIYGLIDEYSAWQAQRLPLVSGGERAMLMRFCRSMDIYSAADITPQKVAFFIGGELSEFYSFRARVALRKFLRYARWAGYPHVPINDKVLEQFMTQAKPGRPVKIEFAREVQTLIGRGKTMRQVKSFLEGKYNQPFYLSSIHRWAKRSI